MHIQRALVCLLVSAAGLLYADDNLVDRYVFGNAERHRIPMAEQSTDAEFLRRVYLDLWGRLPKPAEARKFLASNDPDKRLKIVDSLFPPLPVTGGRSISQSRP
jgi:hypothetical protein